MAGRREPAEGNALQDHAELAGRDVQDGEIRPVVFLKVLSRPDDDQKLRAARQQLWPDVRPLPGLPVGRREQLGSASRGSDTLETPVFDPEVDPAVGSPGSPSRHRRNRTDDQGRPAGQGHLLQFPGREEGQPLPVRGEEGVRPDSVPGMGSISVPVECARMKTGLAVANGKDQAPSIRREDHRGLERPGPQRHAGRQRQGRPDGSGVPSRGRGGLRARPRERRRALPRAARPRPRRRPLRWEPGPGAAGAAAACG